MSSSLTLCRFGMSAENWLNAYMIILFSWIALCHLRAKHCLVDTLRPRKIGRHFPDDNLTCISLMKINILRLIYHWCLFPRVQLTIFQKWLRLWLGAVQAASHYLNQWWLYYRRIHASLGPHELAYIARIPDQVCLHSRFVENETTQLLIVSPSSFNAHVRIYISNDLSQY